MAGLEWWKFRGEEGGGGGEAPKIPEGPRKLIPGPTKVVKVPSGGTTTAAPRQSSAGQMEAAIAAWVPTWVKIVEHDLAQDSQLFVDFLHSPHRSKHIAKIITAFRPNTTGRPHKITKQNTN